MKKILIKWNKIDDKIEKMDDKWELFIITIISVLLVFGVVIGMGTITSGFHLVDDHEFLSWTYQMKHENFRVWNIIAAWIKSDLSARYEPLYYTNRILSCYIFGTNLVMLSLLKAFEIVAALIFLYYCGKLMGARKVHALLFSLMSMIGYQSAVWWKLGPQEAQCTLLFSLGFYSVLKYLNTNRKKWMVVSLVAFLAMVNYKESYIILMPFIILFILYQEVCHESKLTWIRIREAISRRKGYLFCLTLIFVIPVFIIVTYVGTNNYGTVGLDFSKPFKDYIEALTISFSNNLKWYKRFGILFCAILLTYWESLKKLWKEIFLTVTFLLPQIILFGRTEIYERYLLPGAIGFSFFFIIIILKWSVLSGKRRMVYVLGVLLLLAAHGRVALREADYFRYRGESVTSMLEALTEMAKDDTNVLVCFYPNEEGNITVDYWMRLHNFDHVYYYSESDKTVSEECGWMVDYKMAEPVGQRLTEMDIVVMYNREDRHFTYDMTLDLSDYTEIPCGTLTLFVRENSGIKIVNPQIKGLKIHF